MWDWFGEAAVDAAGTAYQLGAGGPALGALDEAFALLTALGVSIVEIVRPGSSEVVARNADAITTAVATGVEAGAAGAISSAVGDADVLGLRTAGEAVGWIAAAVAALGLAYAAGQGATIARALRIR